MSESQALAAGALDESLTPLPDGGTEYSYWVPADPSSVVNVPIPPAGFTPVDASAAQLAEYGFPVRPTDSTALATWTQEMSTYQTRLVPDPTLDFSSPIDGFDHEPPPADYANWGGYISKLLPGELADPHFVGVTGEFAVPTTNNSCGEFPGLSIWTGLGGQHDVSGSEPRKLIQSGISYNWNDVSNPTGDNLWTPFYEVLNTFNQNSPGKLPKTVTGSSSNISAGDLLYSQTSYESSNDIANFTLDDFTTGTDFYYSKTGVPNSYFDGSTAEWVTEFPLGYSYIPHFTSYYWKDATAEQNDGNNYAIDSNANGQTFFPEDLAQLKPNSNDWMNPSSLETGGEIFQDKYIGCVNDLS